MKSKLYIMALACGLFATACSSPADETAANDAPANDTPTTEVAEYTIDTDNSRVLWQGHIVNIKAHEGTLNFTSGKFTTVDGQLSSGEFVVDMTSMVPTDEEYDEESTKEGLVGHLSSPDFFDVANHPRAKLVIKDGKASLTIRDKTNPVELERVNISANGNSVEANAEVKFDRQLFDVSFSQVGKDVFISDEVAIKVELKGTKK